MAGPDGRTGMEPTQAQGDLGLADTEFAPEPTAKPVAAKVQCGLCGVEMSCQLVDPGGKGHVAYCGGCRGQVMDRGAFLPAGYRMMRELGRGGMGAVYLAEHPDQK